MKDLKQRGDNEVAKVLKYVFGPVPSRRLGRSLGINNIPKKYCSYSCVYCQVGRTTNLTVDRSAFYEPGDVVKEVLLAVEDACGKIDYITFVPDGEPTLDVNLGKIINGIKEATENRVAVLTNGSLISSASGDLFNADLVSVKIDAIAEETYRRVNRPHPSLSIFKVLGEIERFSKDFGGTLITETMLLEGVNDGPEDLSKVAEFLAQLSPQRAYLSVPVRPPTEPWVRPSKRISEWYERLGAAGIKAEMLNYQEEGAFGTAGFEDPVSGILKIMNVHPLREDYARRILLEGGVDPDKTIHELVKGRKVRRVEYGGKAYLAPAD
ncbi:MAG: radical SAM protein [Candidatus Methanomethyliaceae archaeon]